MLHYKKLNHMNNKIRFNYLNSQLTCNSLGISQPEVSACEPSSLPSALNLITIPYDFICNIFSLIRSYAIQDKEARLDARLRLYSLPLNALASLGYVGTFCMQLGSILGINGALQTPLLSSKTILYHLNFAALAVSAIEIVFESINIHRQKKFLTYLSHSLVDKVDAFLEESNPKIKKKKLLQVLDLLLEKNELFPLNIQNSLRHLNNPSNEHISEETLQLSQDVLKKVSKMLLLKEANKIQSKYLKISSQEFKRIERIARSRLPSGTDLQIEDEIFDLQNKLLKTKFNQLCKRVSPWCAKDLSEKLEPALKKLRSKEAHISEEGKKEVKELLTLCDIQAKKILIVHIVSLIIFVGCAITSAAVIALCPPMLPVVALTTLGIISSINFLAYHGTINQRGWRFSVVDCIPYFIKWPASKIYQLFQKSAP